MKIENLLAVKKSLPLLFIFILLFLSNQIKAQQNTDAFIDSIYKKAETYRPVISTEINKWENIKKMQLTIEQKVGKIDSIKLIPIVKLTFDATKKGALTPTFSTDSLFQICAVAYPSKKVFLYTFKEQKISLKGNSSTYINEELGHSFAVTKQPLFVYLFDIDRYQLDIIGFPTKKGTLGFHVKGSTELKTTSAMLVYKFGSKETYATYKYKETIKRQIEAKQRQETLKNGKPTNYIKDNWQFYNNHFKNDTARSIGLMLRELQAVTNISNQQLSKFKNKLLNAVKKPLPLENFVIDDQIKTQLRYYGFSPWIIFINTDITKILGSILTPAQFEQYKMQTEVSASRASYMEMSLNARFDNDKKAIDDFVNANIKRPDSIGFSLENIHDKQIIILR